MGYLQFPTVLYHRRALQSGCLLRRVASGHGGPESCVILHLQFGGIRSKSANHGFPFTVTVWNRVDQAVALFGETA